MCVRERQNSSKGITDQPTVSKGSLRIAHTVHFFFLGRPWDFSSAFAQASDDLHKLTVLSLTPPSFPSISTLQRSHSSATTLGQPNAHRDGDVIVMRSSFSYILSPSHWSFSGTVRANHIQPVHPPFLPPGCCEADYGLLPPLPYGSLPMRHRKSIKDCVAFSFFLLFPLFTRHFSGWYVSGTRR